MNLTLPRTRSWQDAFGTAILTLEGGTGGRVVLVVAPLEVGREALEVVLGPRPFKGRLALAVLEEAHSAPIAGAIRALEAKAVIALEPTLQGVAVTGPDLALEPVTHTAPTGLEYQEPAALPAWHAGWMIERVSDLEPHDGVSSLMASTAANLHAPGLVCNVNTLGAVFERILKG